MFHHHLTLYLCELAFFGFQCSWVRVEENNEGVTSSCELRAIFALGKHLRSAHSCFLVSMMKKERKIYAQCESELKVRLRVHGSGT